VNLEQVQPVGLRTFFLRLQFRVVFNCIHVYIFGEDYTINLNKRLEAAFNEQGPERLKSTSCHIVQEKTADSKQRKSSNG
jgi:hypothetical protein